MKITHKMIQDDINRTAALLKKNDMEMPSSWQCMKPGLAIMLGLVVWQFFVASSYTAPGKMNSLYVYGSIGFSAVLGFIIFLGITSLNGKYLSMPRNVRDNCLIINIYRRKIKSFIAAWLVINILFGIVTIFLEFNPMFSSSLTQLVTLIFLFFVFSVDIGRYDLSMFSSMLSTWLNQKNISSTRF